MPLAAKGRFQVPIQPYRKSILAAWCTFRLRLYGHILGHIDFCKLVMLLSFRKNLFHAFLHTAVSMKWPSLQERLHSVTSVSAGYNHFVIFILPIFLFFLFRIFFRRPTTLHAATRAQCCSSQHNVVVRVWVVRLCNVNQSVIYIAQLFLIFEKPSICNHTENIIRRHLPTGAKVILLFLNHLLLIIMSLTASAALSLYWACRTLDKSSRV